MNIDHRIISIISISPVQTSVTQKMICNSEDAKMTKEQHLLRERVIQLEVSVRKAKEALATFSYSPPKMSLWKRLRHQIS